MAAVPRRFGGVLLGTSAAAIGTVPAGASYVLRRLSLTNTSAANRTVQLWLVPSGGSAGDATRIVKDKVLLAGETWSVPDIEGHVLAAGGTVQGSADTGSAVAAVGSATEIV